MEAIVFDIDGTLIDSFEADAEIFIAVVKRVLGIAEIDSDWSSYRHVTDQGVLRQIMKVNGIDPVPALFEATRREFAEALRQHIEEHGPFREVPGAIDFVSRLIASSERYVAYATGAWRESALIKLESAGFPVDGVVISTSSDFEDRVSIMKAAISGAPSEIEKITYYGDGAWDRAAVRELGWNFVAVGEALGGLRSYHEAV